MSTGGDGTALVTCGATMKALRRALLALGAAGVFAAVVRLRGTGGTPPQGGGWRELSGPDLR
jgi:hypothetical protein